MTRPSVMQNLNVDKSLFRSLQTIYDNNAVNSIAGWTKERDGLIKRTTANSHAANQPTLLIYNSSQKPLTQSIK